MATEESGAVRPAEEAEPRVSPAESLARLNNKEQIVVRQLLRILQTTQNVAKLSDGTLDAMRTPGLPSGSQEATVARSRCWTTDAGTVARFAQLHDLVDNVFQEKPATPEEADRREAMVKKCDTVALGIIARVGVEHTRIHDSFAFAGDLGEQLVHEQLLMVRRLTTYTKSARGVDVEQTETDTEKDLTEGASSREIAIIVANLIIGNALVAMPYGFVLAGWVALPVAMFTVCILAFTGILLGSAFGAMRDRGVPNPNVGDVSRAVLGAWSPVFEVFCLGECTFMCVWLFIFCGNSFAAIIGCAPAPVIMCCGVFAWLLFLIPRRIFTALSFFGLGLTLFALGAVMGTGLMLPEMETTQVLATPAWASGSVAMSAFTALTVGDHAIFGNIYSAAAHEKAFRRGLCGGFAIFGAVAFLLLSVCYATFGDALKPVSLNNIGRDANLEMLPGWAWLFVFSNLALAVRGLIMLPAFLRPLINFFAQVVERGTGSDMLVPAKLESELSLLRASPKKFVMRMVLIAALVGTCAVSATLLSHQIAALATLTGALFKTVNCFWLPCMGVWMLTKPSWRKRALILLVLLPATAWGITGTLSSVKQILSGAAMS